MLSWKYKYLAVQWYFFKIGDLLAFDVPNILQLLSEQLRYVLYQMLNSLSLKFRWCGLSIVNVRWLVWDELFAVVRNVNTLILKIFYLAVGPVRNNHNLVFEVCHWIYRDRWNIGCSTFHNGVVSYPGSLPFSQPRWPRRDGAFFWRYLILHTIMGNLFYGERSIVVVVIFGPGRWANWQNWAMKIADWL